MELVAGILGFVYRGKVEEKVKEEAPILMARYNASNEDGVFKTWAVVQSKLVSSPIQASTTGAQASN